MEKYFKGDTIICKAIYKRSKAKVTVGKEYIVTKHERGYWMNDWHTKRIWLEDDTGNIVGMEGDTIDKVFLKKDIVYPPIMRGDYFEVFEGGEPIGIHRVKDIYINGVESPNNFSATIVMDDGKQPYETNIRLLLDRITYRPILKNDPNYPKLWE